MSWDLSSEDVIIAKLESQQRTIEMFSKAITKLKAELKQEREVVDKCFDGAIMRHPDNLKEIERITREQQNKRGEG